MALTYIPFGTPEILLVLIALLLVVAAANYGKDTVLGYWGTILLAIFTTPLIAFVVVFILKMKRTT